MRREKIHNPIYAQTHMLLEYNEHEWVVPAMPHNLCQNILIEHVDDFLDLPMEFSLPLLEESHLRDLRVNTKGCHQLTLANKDITLKFKLKLSNLLKL